MRTISLCVLCIIFSYFAVSHFSITPENDLSDHFSLLSDTYPAIGAQNTVVILVEFLDVKHEVKSGDIYEVIFEKMNEYYMWVSYNLTWLTGRVFDNWFQMPKSLKEYTWDGKTEPWIYFKSFLEAVIEIADSDIDFSEYSKTIIVHAGTNQNFNGSFGFYGMGIPADGVLVNDLTVNAESDDVAIFAHEFGHTLHLPDLYAFPDFDRRYVGSWDIMSKPMGQGMLAWSKIRLGWIPESQVYRAKLGNIANVTIDPIESRSSGFYSVRIDLPDGTYYLVEARQKIGYDKVLPDNGVIITLINESKVYGWGEGPVVLRDAHINTPTLDDAPFDFGLGEISVFIDQENNLAVIILQKLDLSYSIQITTAMQGEMALKSSSMISGINKTINSDWWVIKLFGGAMLLQKAFSAYISGNYENALELAKQANEAHTKEKVATATIVGLILVTSLLICWRLSKQHRNLN